VKSMLARRPSPALAIACVALFVSLGGVSYGVATGSIDSREIKNNTVRSLDLRNNDVRGRDIRNSTIQGRDVALNTLGGSDINESRLGRVPRAANADSATTARTAVSVLSQRPIAPAGVAEGDSRTLAVYGPFTITASCVAAGGDTVSRVAIATSEAGSSTAADADFGPGDGAVTVDSTTDVAGADPTLEDYSFSGFAPSGRAFTATVSSLANASAGVGACRFHGNVLIDG
jgi:hypothetical protein